MITSASLFSGIGGFDLAADVIGWENKFTCEKDAFCNRVLKYYWKDIQHYEDIKTTDFTIWRGKIDVLTGGFPCQPFSLAGKRKGTDDDRHLWPEMLRAIREIQPNFIVGENVYGIVNWDGGTVFEQVQTDLETQGYEVITIVLPACAVNAPHRRDRTWFIAANSNLYTKRTSRESEKSKTSRGKIIMEPGQRRAKAKQYIRSYEFSWFNPNSSNSRNKAMYRREIISNRQFFTSNTQSKQSEWMRPKQRELSEQKQGKFRGNNSEMGYGDVTNAGCKGLQGCGRFYSSSREIETCSYSKITPSNSNSRRQPSKEYRETESRLFAKKSFSNYWCNFPTQSPICDRNDGISYRLVDITFPKWRNESIKAMGNAIVPEVAIEIFKVIDKIIKEKLL